MALRNLQLKRRYRVAILVGAVMCLLFPVSCHRAEDPEAFLKQEMTRIQEITIPPGAEMLASSGPEHRDGSMTADWEFRTEWESEVYLRWVTPRLSNSFQTLRSHESQLSFSRRLDGDAEFLTIKFVSETPRLHVRLTFAAYPD